MGSVGFLVEGRNGTSVADAAPLLSSQALPFQVHTIHTSNHQHHHLAVGASLPREQQSRSHWGSPQSVMGQGIQARSPAPQVGGSGMSVPLPPRGPSGLTSRCPHGDSLGDSPLVASFPPLLLPAINSQISYLTSNPCLGVYFW